MSTKTRHIILILFTIILIVASIFFHKYRELKHRIESSADSAYRSVILESIHYKKELDRYIKSNKTTDKTKLTLYTNNIKNAFDHYGLITIMVDGTTQRLYTERSDFYYQYWHLFPPDYAELTLEELQKVSDKTNIIIKELQRLK
ncbi:hypothetical protein Q0V21_11730 [Paenibacillus sp. 11B]|uniref:hypothetical protein n=1 Tax=Paenibacillus sp. 11B TaxID=3060965 RepID=UPI00264D2F63|nr:hypothetical protein [Paenibacillus sp. 11B]MDN8589442.1 hypothetical protein [Paenibacillus sp. 11B]